MTQALLTLSTAPNFEDDLVDWLLVQGSTEGALENCHIQGFSSWNGYGHGAEIATLSIAEQVAGRQKRVFFSLQGDERNLTKLVNKLSEDYPNVDVHFWLQPVIMAGRIKVVN